MTTTQSEPLRSSHRAKLTGFNTRLNRFSIPQQTQLSKEVTLRMAKLEDVPALANIYGENLSTDFLVKLGPSFLLRTLFPMLLQSPRVSTYVAERKGCVVAFFMTRIGMDGVLSEILRFRPLEFAVSCAFSLLRRPSMIRECFSICSQLRWRNISKTDDIIGDMFLLAVAASARRLGIARALVLQGILGLRDQGVTHLRSIPHEENKASIALFCNIGFVDCGIMHFAGKAWRKLDLRVPAIGDDNEQL